MNKILRLVVVAILVGWGASMLADFIERYAEHSHRHNQYILLAASHLCADSAQRVATSDVNNCAAAQRYATGEVLAPAASAALEAMSDLAICGRNGVRCQQVLYAMSQSSFLVVFVATVMGCAAVWIMWQKHTIETAYSRELPLSSHKYPHTVPFYIAQKED